MSLLDVLKSHIDTSCIMIYGDVTDCLISRDLVSREFSVYLHDILSECGYDNIVFYDFTSASGLYVYDDKSAYYSISIAKEPYLKKYGKAPSCNDMQGVEPPQYATRQDVQPPRKFGNHQPKVLGKAPLPQATPSTHSTTTDNIADMSVKVPYQLKNLEPAVFYGYFVELMKRTDIKTAFIFDIYSFLRDSTSSRNIHNILYQWRNPNNIVIFLNPEGKSGGGNNDGEFRHMLSSAELFRYFYEDDGKGNARYRPDKCFGVSRFQKDEIRNILDKYRILKNIQLDDSSDISDKISYILNQTPALQHISLRKLDYMLSEYFNVNANVLSNKEMYESIFQIKYDAYCFDPFNKLMERCGWQEATEQLIHKLAELISGDKDDFPGSIQEQYTWLVEHCRPIAKNSLDSLITERFDSNLTVQYPNAASLPHMMIIGNPGTGKSTSVDLIGRILHDVGLLKIGHVKHISGGELQGAHVGETPGKVAEILDECEHGVLFVDEAYALCKNFEKNGNAGTFAQEAVDTLVNAMTDENRHVVIVFAGYPSSDPNDSKDLNSVRGLLKMNSGLERRIKIELVIEDYKPEVLAEIFYQNIKANEISLGEDIKEENIKSYMQYFYQTRTGNFGNADFVEKTVRSCIISAQARKSKEINRCDFGDNALFLEPVSVESAKEELRKYPGLSEVGEAIIDTSVNLYQNRQKNGIEYPGAPKHIILVGKRGTGKTTLARIICKAWGAVGMMSGRVPVTIENPAAVSHEKLKEEMKRAIHENTPLFIDEAHNSPEEVIQDMLSPMTEYKNLTCIFAVYPERKEEFLDKDYGLRERCDLYEIDDYTPEQLIEIFKSFLKRQNRTADDSCIQALKIWFENAYAARRSNKYYANARMVENIVERLETSTDRAEFTADDLPKDMKEVIDIHSHKLSFDDIMSKFDEYIGWDELRSYLMNVRNDVEYARKFPNSPVKPEITHLLFVGNPGTGKTEAGKIFAEACYSIGLTKTDHFQSYGSNDLIAGYVGQTGIKTAEALQRGRDGVIFIDEAYNLSYNEMTGNADFKREAIDVLLRFCSEEQGRTIIILAGYEDRMQKMLSSNPGLSSRFQYTVHFPDFTTAQCKEIILKNMAGFEISADAFEDAETYLETCMHLPRDWGNARDLNGIAGSIKGVYKARVVSEASDDATINRDDVNHGFDSWIARNGGTK